MFQKHCVYFEMPDSKQPDVTVKVLEDSFNSNLRKKHQYVMK